MNNPWTAHENDLEGAVVVLEKAAEGVRMVAVETVFHRRFKRYAPEDSDG